MLTPTDRIKLLELTRPNVTNPDLKLWVGRARELEAYVMERGQSLSDPHKPIPTRAPEARTTAPLGGPAKKVP